MSRWADQFSKLAIHATIETAIEALDFESEELNAEVASEHRRLKKGI